MQKTDLCKKIVNSVRHIIIAEPDKINSSGTGVIVRQDGLLLTANHVLVDKNTNKLFAGLLIIKDFQGKQTPYQIYAHSISFDVGVPEFARPLSIDLAILIPSSRYVADTFLPPTDRLAIEGEDVIMCGFPDEVELPLNFEKSLDFTNETLQKSKSDIGNFLKYGIRQYFLKHGMVGKITNVKFQGKSELKGKEEKFSIHGGIYWIDNASNLGSSGGPVVDADGNLLGIICKRGLTDTDFSLANSTMALSHHLISWVLN